jgi:hypothetical protein
MRASNRGPGSTPRARHVPGMTNLDALVRLGLLAFMLSVAMLSSLR